MGNLVDVHIIVGNKEKWLPECLESLEHQPINIHFVDRIEGNVAKAREIGFSKGTCEYVSFVDPDDLVYPGVFIKCLGEIWQNPSCVGVYTNDMLIDEQGQFIGYGWGMNQEPFDEMGFPPELTNGIHHLRVFKREAVNKCLPLKHKMIPEPLLNTEIQNHGRLIHIPVIGYKWRMHKQNTFTKYKREELEQAVEIAKELNGPIKSIR
jgi:hypothetical protein